MSLPRYADFLSVRTRDLSWLDTSGAPPVVNSLLTVGQNPWAPDRASWTRDPSLNSVTLGGTGTLTYSGGSLLVNGVPVGGGGSGATGPTGATGPAGPAGATGPTGSFSPNGNNYSDYIYWDNVTSSWQVDSNEIHIGRIAGQVSQGNYGIAIGARAGNNTQGIYAVALGTDAGLTSQGGYAIAAGTSAGETSQGAYSVAIGYNSGKQQQQQNTVAVGRSAGFRDQSENAVAIGYNAGQDDQGLSAVAIGDNAALINQGAYSIAIGKVAGYINQPANSIAINATGVALNPDASGFYAAPVRDSSSGICAALRYDVSRNEIVRSNFGIYGVGLLTLPAGGDCSGDVIFPGMTPDGIVMLSIKYSSDENHSNLLTVSYKCDVNTFRIYSDFGSDFPINVTWAVVKL